MSFEAELEEARGENPLSKLFGVNEEYIPYYEQTDQEQLDELIAGKQRISDVRIWVEEHIPGGHYFDDEFALVESNIQSVLNDAIYLGEKVIQGETALKKIFHGAKQIAHFTETGDTMHEDLEPIITIPSGRGVTIFPTEHPNEFHPDVQTLLHTGSTAHTEQEGWYDGVLSAIY